MSLSFLFSFRHVHFFLFFDLCIIFTFGFDFSCLAYV
jgi:hypothetical protein